MRQKEGSLLLRLLHPLEPFVGPGDFEGTDFPEFWKLVDRNGVGLSVMNRLTKSGVRVSDLNPPEKLLSQVQKDRDLGAKRHQHFSEVLGLLREKGIFVCLLKGACFGPLYFADPLYKRMNDSDILIRDVDLEDVREVLKACGFTSFQKQEKVMGAHQTSPFFHPLAGSVIGIHLNIASPSAFKLNPRDLRASVLPLQYGSHQVYRLSPEYNLLHLCIHLPFQKTGLREFLDISRLLSREKPDWNGFFRLARKCGAAERVFRVLTLTKAIYPDLPMPALPEDFVKKARRFVKKDTEKRQKYLLTSRFTVMASVERNFLLFRLSEDKYEKKMALQNLFRDLSGKNHPPLTVRNIFQTLVYEHGFRKVIFSLGLLGLSFLRYGLYKGSRPLDPARLLSQRFSFLMELE